MGSRAKIIILKNDHWCTNRHMSTKTVLTVYQQCTNRQKTVKTAKMTIGVPIITGLPRLYQQCSNSVPIIKNSQNQSNSKNDHWCTNRHMSTQSPPNTQSPRPRPPSASGFASASVSAEYTKPRSLKIIENGII